MPLDRGQLFEPVAAVGRQEDHVGLAAQSSGDTRAARGNFARKRIVFHVEENDRGSRLYAEFVEPGRRVLNPVGPSRGNGSECEHGDVTTKLHTQCAVSGRHGRDVEVRNGEPHVASTEDQRVGLEQRLAINLGAAEGERAFGFLAHTLTFGELQTSDCRVQIH